MGKPKLRLRKTNYPPAIFGRFADSEVAEIAAEVMRKYKVCPSEAPTVNHIVNGLTVFCEASGTMGEALTLNREKIRAMKVLDIACGSPFTFQQGTGDRRLAATMKPWLCRTLSHLGAEVMGTDIYYPDYVSENAGHGKRRMVPVIDREWLFVQRDLFLPDALDEGTFKSGSFDFVNCQDFVGYE